MPDRPLLAVDGDNVAHRAFHALPDSIKGAEGQPANMLLGFANMLVAAWENEQPRCVFVAFDSVGEPTYRHELLASYQEGRDFPSHLMAQLEKLPEFVEALGFPWAKAAGYEADDFLAAAVMAEEERDGSAVVLTNDRDLFQLASEKTTILKPRGKGEFDRIGPAEVRQVYGVDPEQVPEFVALRGDPSDGIPGAKGVGAGRAATILKQYETLDAAVEAGLFPRQEDQLRQYVRITRLQYHAPIPDLPDAQPNWTAAAEVAKRWGLGALTTRLEERAGSRN